LAGFPMKSCHDPSLTLLPFLFQKDFQPTKVDF